MRVARVGRSAQQAVAEVFDNLGGVEALTEWARANPDKFYLFLWPRLLPKEVRAEIETGSNGLVLNAVQVRDPAGALEALERMRYDGNTHSGCGGSGNEESVGRAFPTHETCVQEVDGSGAGNQQADNTADATTPWQDDVVQPNPTVPLPQYVPLA